MPYLLSSACWSNRPAALERPYALLLILASALLWSGCAKTLELEELELLTGKDWRLVQVTFDGDDGTEDCHLDDVLSFQDATRFSYDWGELSCFEPSDIRLEADSWKVFDRRPTIQLKYKLRSRTGFGSTMEYWEIVELTESVLVLKDDASDNKNRPTEVRRYEN
jgi:hypothetical protein